jgi:hypothetical protein
MVCREPDDLREQVLLAKFGPLKSYPTGQRIDSSVDPDRLVKTHCCFCGQQCGIQLKVKDNEVIGFEPWEDFPFNRGMLCPKGVRRYLQGSHHDRLTSAYFHDQSSPEGFRAVPYGEAIRRVAPLLLFLPRRLAILGRELMETAGQRIEGGVSGVGDRRSAHRWRGPGRLHGTEPRQAFTLVGGGGRLAAPIRDEKRGG